MRFNSVVFIIFALIFFVLWPWVRQRRQVRWAVLVIASFIFYGWWDWRFLFLIIVSGLIDFLAGLGIECFPRRRKWLMGLSLAGNLGLLAAFKYSTFLAQSLESLLAHAGLTIHLSQHIPDFCLILPVGISFYTFQSLSYTIDIYQGRLKPIRQPLQFFAYLALFPQLVAGPIVRARDLLGQLDQEVTFDGARRWRGTRLIIYGFFKKVVIADNIGRTVNFAFSNVGLYDQSTYWWMMALFFGIQIYCDFSGYSDIARGLANWMGYDFPENFHFPYFSRSLKEFWQRWHISLSSWFRDYVYIPLGGNRGGLPTVQGRILGTMLLSGLWHGASWNFVLWGGMHGTLLVFEKVFQFPKRLLGNVFGSALMWTVVLAEVTAAWVLFRAADLHQAGQIYACMFSFSGPLFPTAGMDGLVYFSIFAVMEVCIAGGLWRRAHIPLMLRPHLEASFWALLAVASIFFRGPSQAFIYFQF